MSKETSTQDVNEIDLPNMEAVRSALCASLGCAIDRVNTPDALQMDDPCVSLMQAVRENPRISVNIGTFRQKRR